jgi:hypothetical protein
MAGLGLIMLTGTSCAKVYYGPNAETTVSQYNRLAVIPPEVTISGRRYMDAVALRNLEASTSGLIQAEMYSWLLRRNAQGRFRPQPQSIDNTNVLLDRYDFYVKPMTSQELCRLLEVDGLIYSNYSLDQPLTEGGAVALAVLTGVYGPTNRVFVDYRIQDCRSDQLMYSYNRRLSGSLGSSPESLVDGLMRRISKRMPGYKR